jgi:hypothetical protein
MKVILTPAQKITAHPGPQKNQRDNPAMLQQTTVPHDQIAVALTYEAADHRVFLAPWFADELTAEAVADYLTGAIEALEGIRDGFELLAEITEETSTVH